jgi:hypothetical protein
MSVSDWVCNNTRAKQTMLPKTCCTAIGIVALVVASKEYGTYLERSKSVAHLVMMDTHNLRPDLEPITHRISKEVFIHTPSTLFVSPIHFIQSTPNLSPLTSP